MNVIRTIIRRIRMAYQVLTTGWCECHVWDLDGTIADFLVPKLEKFAEIDNGRPMCFKDSREWRRCVRRMAWAFKRKDRPLTPFLEARERRGLHEFALYFNHLWD